MRSMELTPQMKDLTGLRFDKLVVVCFAGRDRELSRTYWRVECDCGTIKEVMGHALTTGQTKSCGCIRGGHNFVDLTGQRFGRLLVTGPHRRENMSTFWTVICDCGTVKEVISGNLRGGSKTRSCGCITKEKLTTHGRTYSNVYNVWCSMKQRCHDPNCGSYKNYGGRGIRVCKRWRDSFEAFYEDMGDPPVGHSIDRIDNDGNYTPENCKWSTRQEQSRNTRSNRYITHAGRTQTLADWAKETGVARQTIDKRLLRGCTIKEALKPAKK